MTCETCIAREIREAVEAEREALIRCAETIQSGVDELRLQAAKEKNGTAEYCMELQMNLCDQLIAAIRAKKP